MAYRKTEKVLAQLEAKRNSFIAAAIDVIAKSGMEGLTTDAVAARADVADGLLYKYFPDKTELLAAVVHHVLARDLAAMRGAIGNSSPHDALETSLALLFTRASSNYRVMAAISQMPVYREGMRRELARLIRATGAETPPLLAAIAYGALFEAAGSYRPKDEPALTASLLRAFGVRVSA